MKDKISLTNDFEQASERYRSLAKVDQDHWVDNIVDSRRKADKRALLIPCSNSPALEKDRLLLSGS